jgi:hypothetical protein
MEKKQPSYSQLGMLFGIAIGGGIGVLLFVFSNDALFFSVTGIGLVVGMIIGAGMDRRKENTSGE